MATVTIEVTQEDIDNGLSNDCRHCPVARATMRGIPLVHGVSVRGANVTLYPSFSAAGCKAALPTKAKHFIVDFDAGLRVLPFAFDLEVPSDLVAV